MFPVISENINSLRQKSDYQAISDGNRNAETRIYNDEMKEVCISNHDSRACYVIGHYEVRKSFEQQGCYNARRFGGICLIIFTLAYIVFLCSGAVLFLMIESPMEINAREELLAIQHNFLMQNPCVSVESLNVLLESILVAKSNGIDVPLIYSKDQVSKMKHYKNMFMKMENNSFISDSTTPSHNMNSQVKSLNPSTKKNPNLYSISLINKFLEDNRHTSHSEKSINGTENMLISASVTHYADLKKVENSNEHYIKQNFQYKWSFKSSLMFVISIVTTIGYGNITPLSEFGRIMTIIFSAFGIPATLTLCSCCVTLLLRGPISFLEKLIYSIYWCFVRKSDNTQQLRLAVTQFLIITVILMLSFLVLPAYIFYKNIGTLKNWNYFDCFYYCYISITTIGLGDYVLDNLWVIIYLYTGLISIMCWLAMFYRIPQLNIVYMMVGN